MIRPVGVLFASLAAASVAFAAEPAGEFSFSAKVDKTSVELGSSMTLVLTLTGDIAGVELPKIQLPEGFSIGGTSQATNFSLQQGGVRRSIGLTYVLVPQHEGTFQIGPFVIRRGTQDYHTEPIEITVTKPAVPKDSEPKRGERFIL